MGMGIITKDVTGGLCIGVLWAGAGQMSGWMGREPAALQCRSTAISIDTLLPPALWRVG